MNFSGSGNNKAFKIANDPAAPYYYLSGTLDLAGAVAGGTYYFNLDNSTEYAFNRDYNRYLMVDDANLISEVIVYADEDIIPAEGESPEFLIGGADKMDADEPYVKVPWAAPAQSAPAVPPAFVGDVVTWEEVNAGTVNYFGHEGGHFPYFENLSSAPDLSKRYKYLAVTVNPDALLAARAKELQGDAKQRKKKKLYRGLPEGAPVVLEGKLTVTLKIYPKAQ
jgi:hypothetical protein